MAYQEHIRPVEAALTAADSFTLNLYAGVYNLFYYVQGLTAFGGDNLESYFQRFPFLKHYFSEISSAMPKNIVWEDGRRWWYQSVTELEDASQVSLPLKALRNDLGMDYESRLVLMLTGLVEEDSRFGTVFAQLQQPLGYRRPMLETLGHIALKGAENEARSAWDVCGPLISLGLIEAENTSMPRAEWLLKVRSPVWELIRGGQYNQEQDDKLPGIHVPAEALCHVNQLVVEEAFAEHLKAIPKLVNENEVRLIVLKALQGSHSVDVLGSIAHQLGKAVLVSKCDPNRETKLCESFGPICTILNAMPVFTYELTPGEVVSIPKITGYSGPVAVAMGPEGGIKDTDQSQTLTLNLPDLSPVLRERLWRQKLPQGWLLDDPLQISKKFRVPGDYIHQLMQLSQKYAALESRHCITQVDVQKASRSLNRQLLDELADPLDAKGSWGHLVTVDTTAEKLFELQQRCSYREQILDQLGHAFQNNANCGVRALFTGRSGTGKTLAAKILAAELGMDIYRVDLASIVNKYIGETEKNLHKVLTRAEALDVILLLDEGDALLGSRTDVKNANDRYANLETNYLLQRLEHYQGIVLITTNLADNIDKAFQRRMDIVVPFFQPQKEQRLAIFQLHLPERHEIEYEFLEEVSKHCTLMGGQIRNVCLHASLMALDEGVILANRHLEYALRSEYRKNNGTFPLDGGMPSPESDGGMRNFVQALAQGR